MREDGRGERGVPGVAVGVVGDPLDVIASGPTAPDPSTFADALAVVPPHAGIEVGGALEVIPLR